MPDAELPVGEVAEELIPDTPVEETPEVPAEEQIEIGERTFKTQAEALAFARSELGRREQEAAVAEAYRAGVADLAAHSAPAAAAAAPEENWEEKFYANPKETLNQYAEKIRAEVLSTVGQQTEDQKLWAQFKTKHPDLDGFEDDVSVTLKKFNNEIKGIASTKGVDEAMKFLAQKTRVKFQEYIDRAKPRRVLDNTPAGGAPMSQSNVTPKIVIEKPLSFTEQVKQNRAKRMS